MTLDREKYLAQHVPEGIEYGDRVRYTQKTMTGQWIEGEGTFELHWFGIEEHWTVRLDTGYSVNLTPCFGDKMEKIEENVIAKALREGVKEIRPKVEEALDRIATELTFNGAAYIIRNAEGAIEFLDPSKVRLISPAMEAAGYALQIPDAQRVHLPKPQGDRT